MEQGKKYPNNLRMLRHWRNLSQDMLAEKARCSQTTISHYEQEKGLISARIQEKLSKALDVPKSMLMDPVAVVPSRWKRLVTDMQLRVLVEHLLKYNSKDLVLASHRLHGHNHLPGGESDGYNV